LDAVAQWISSSRLCLNVVKSNALLIGSQQRLSDKTLTVSIGGTVLNQVKSVRYLGVLIDSTLSWSLHITGVVSRVRLFWNFTTCRTVFVVFHLCLASV